MAKATFSHFLPIGCSPDNREFSIDLRALDSREFDLSSSIHRGGNLGAIKLLPAGKASGPNGFTLEFLRVCWPVTKKDICEAFDKLF